MYATPRSPNRKTRGQIVGTIAAALGQPFMPWQQFVADVANEVLPDGSPAYREVIVSVPRQSGKTTLTLAQEVERCTTRSRPQHVAYTAQTGSDARKKMLNDQVPILEGSPIWRSVRRVARANDNAGIIFANGSRIDVMASNASAGHGKVLDLGIVDEAFDDIDDRREQSMLPAMITKPDAQLWVISTQGTDASVYLNRKIELGRAAALEGRTSGICYFEWAISDELDIHDPASWWTGMPALGHTINVDAVTHAKSTMSEGEFRRAFGNQRMRSSERVIPEVTWRVACRDDVAPSGALSFGVDVSPDRDWASIAVAGNGVVELVDHRGGVGWVVDRLVDLVVAHGGSVALESPRSPVGTLVPALRGAGVHVVELSASDITQACGSFYDAIADAKIKIRIGEHFAALDNAAAAVVKQPVADAWRWARKGADPITPLVAVTAAAWCSRTPPRSGEFVSLILGG
jgi:phage terminase large subunit-like protein